MTAAQKIAKEKFKKAIAIRKKTGVSLKEAFAQVYGKKKVGAVKKKKAAPKKAAKKVVKKAAPKKAAKKVVKKAAPKNVVQKSKPRYSAKKHKNWATIPAHKRRVNGMENHKDTKSHNVNIRVVSGIGSLAMDKYKKALNDIQNLENALNRNLMQMKQFPYKTPFWKKTFQEKNKQIKSLIKELKTHSKELKKSF